MLLRLRLAVGEAADLDVEEVDLPVGRDELAFGVEDEAGVRELLAALAALGDRAADERDAVRLGPAAHRLDRLAALDRLGGLVEDIRRADDVPLLGEGDDVGAGRRGLRDEPLSLFEVRSLLLPARELDAGNADPIGHATAG